MRIIPKRTKVRLELFKGVEVIDVFIGGIGISLVGTVIFSNLPGRFILAMILLLITISLLFPIDDDKGYMYLYFVIKYLARPKVIRKKHAAEVSEETEEKNKKKGLSVGKKGANTNFTVESLTPFTGIDGEFIEYGKLYSAVVLQIDPVEFRFYSASRQNSIIDRCVGGILRTCGPDETISLVKLDRPIIYDQQIKREQEKIKDLEESYLNGLLSEEELTVRVGIIYDRIEQLKVFNEREQVYYASQYLVFLDKDRGMLRNQARDAVDSLASNNIEARQLKGPELAIFLKYSYGNSFNEREAYQLKPEQYLDWILPDKITFTPRTVKFDDLITHNFRFREYPTLVGNAWGARFFNELGTKVVMKIKPIDRYKGIRQIDRSIQELQETKNNTGKASKFLETDEHIQSLAEVLRLMQGENETLFNVNTFIAVDDYEMSEQVLRGQKPDTTHSAKKKVRRELAEEGFRVTDALLQPFEAYGSEQISAYDAFQNYARGIHSSSVAAAFPYVNKFLNDKDGMYLGNSGGVPAFLNFFQRDRERVNSNTVIIGKSGSGKSYATKTILTQLAGEDSKIFILDPENEYSKLAENLNGKIIDVGSATQGRLNPFHIITSLTDEESEEGESANSFNVHLQFLEEFYRQILPGIDNDALEYLNTLTVRMYEQKGIDEDTDLSTLGPEDYPIFDDLYDKIINDIQTSSGEYTKTNLTVLLNYISKFSTGGRNSNLWNGEASISTKENFIVFNFQSLLANKNNIIANGQMLLVLKWLDNEIIKNRDYNMKYHANRKIVVVIDEAHVFIDSKFPIALDFMFQLAKRIRKYNGMQIVITQNIKDFVGTEDLARKSTAIINASQYSFIFPLAPNDMTDLVKLYENAGAINESEQEDIVNNGRGRAFVITSSSERTSIDIVASKGIEDLFMMT